MHNQRMANDLQPYQLEPLMTAEELASYREIVSSIREEDSDSEDKERNDRDSRIGNSHSCTCGRCVGMPTVAESYCCNELREVRDKMGRTHV